MTVYCTSILLKSCGPLILLRIILRVVSVWSFEGSPHLTNCSMVDDIKTAILVLSPAVNRVLKKRCPHLNSIAYLFSHIKTFFLLFNFYDNGIRICISKLIDHQQETQRSATMKVVSVISNMISQHNFSIIVAYSRKQFIILISLFGCIYVQLFCVGMCRKRSLNLRYSISS